MKKLVAIAVFASACAAGAPINSAEREKAIAHLEKTRSGFLTSIRGLSAEQWSFKPAPEVWSAAEVAEHITVSESFILELVQNKVLPAPSDPAAIAEAKGKDEQVLQMVPDRTERFKAPEFLHPKARWTQAELPGVFGGARAKTIEFVRTTQDDLRGHTAPHPVLKTLDAYQWILLLSAHSERHTKQIEEVKSHPNFPKSTSAQTLTPAERDKAISHLEASRAKFLESIRGLSAEQWSFKPAPEVWSVGEVAEHITLSEGSLMDLIQYKMLKAPPTPELAEKARGRDDEIVRRVTDRSQKAQAPEFLQPKSKWARTAIPAEFNTRRTRTIDFVRATQEDLRGRAFAFGGGQPADAFQYVLLISAHTLRHTAQIEEVKANPNFPKK